MSVKKYLKADEKELKMRVKKYLKAAKDFKD